MLRTRQNLQLALLARLLLCVLAINSCDGDVPAPDGEDIR